MMNLREFNKLKYLFLLVFWFKYLCADSTYAHRQRRTFVPWLIVPPTAPTRHQLIVGFGVPVPLSDHSVTIGFVIKGQYFLPISIDDLKPDFFWFNDSRRKLKRSVPDNSFSVNNSENVTYYDEVNQVNVERYVVEPVEIDRHTEQQFDDHIDDNNLNAPPKVWDYDSTENNRLKDSRSSVYKAIEGILSYNEMEGHKCLLKTICELSETKISYESGILGELINVLLTPSSTTNRENDQMDDYHQAERNGKSGKSCANLYSECSASLTDIFSRIHEIMTAR